MVQQKSAGFGDCPEFESEPACKKLITELLCFSEPHCLGNGDHYTCSVGLLQGLNEILYEKAWHKVNVNH